MNNTIEETSSASNPDIDHDQLNPSPIEYVHPNLSSATYSSSNSQRKQPTYASILVSAPQGMYLVDSTFEIFKPDIIYRKGPS